MHAVLASNFAQKRISVKEVDFSFNSASRNKYFLAKYLMKIYLPKAGNFCNIDDVRVKSFSNHPIQVYAQQHYCKKE